ncbi:MAG: amino acid adenylation domain-containing protein [Planctomycetota bacterium]|jgi:amino acid adenylation domain-containing protein|nr:amino acid adenylation domain-containing protein [Planctomycetota bacterium]MDP6761661.1 amino acid adenylation domain-containing protein [Planctomycetota bacterium]
MNLHAYLASAARERSGHAAVVAQGHKALDYRGLDALSDRLRDRLVALGVAPGDRVGLCVPKSADSVAALYAVLKCGAAYVPVDATAPAGRNAFILADCGVRAVLVEAAAADALVEALAELGAGPSALRLEGVGDGSGLAAALDAADAAGEAQATETVEAAADDLAYILYTSGSTGKPKGVEITHRNATSFVEWAHGALGTGADDRFSSHAPFHFDLSIFDLYVAAKSGATLVLVGEEAGKEPVGLARLIAAERISVWYSTPSVLSLLVQYGKLETLDLSSLRLVLFAGEVFPIVHLAALKELLPDPVYFNLYGPTETNVCTYYRIPERVAEGRVEPYPIGVVCDHLAARVVDEGGADVEAGSEGELVISGPAVTRGYWGLAELTAASRLEGDGAVVWYRTGDLVVEEEGGNYRFVGRRDRMIKKRGFRVELGEIEACLSRFPLVREVAVVALEGEDGVRVKAHLATGDGGRISLLKLKPFCAEHLPLYMVPDAFAFHEALPKTSTDKIDYQALLALEGE